MMSDNLAPHGALQQFLELSCVLTGFDRFELTGTAQTAAYFDWLHTHKAEQFMQLLACWEQAPQEALERQAWLEEEILNSASFSLLARSIIKLWYLGQWFPSEDPNVSEIPSAQSYQQGLVWNAIYAHPQASKQQGFGAWSEPPLMDREMPS